MYFIQIQLLSATKTRSARRQIQIGCTDAYYKRISRTYRREKRVFTWENDRVPT